MEKIVYKVMSDKPLSLKDFLMGQMNVSRRLLTKLKRLENGVTRNGEFIRSVDKVFKGDEIIISMQDEKFLEPNGTLNVKIAYESENTVVFEKPVGMPVHPSIKHQGDTLGNYFAYLYPNLTFRPVNRLDRDTSGLCLIAKNAHSANVLQKNVEKTYYAVAGGVISSDGTIDAPIKRAEESIILRCVSEDGQRAVTHYKVISGNERCTLLEIHLETGRTHQIRVHFAHIGHPLEGDSLYGGSEEFISEHALHCGELRFSEPVSGESVTVKSEIRIDMKQLLNK